MTLAIQAELREALLAELGETATVGGVDVPVIPLVEDDIDAPAAGLAYRANQRGLSFYDVDVAAAGVALMIGTRLTWRGSDWEVDGTLSTDENRVTVLVIPVP